MSDDEAFEVRVPPLGGESVTEVVVEEWLAEPGSEVEEGQPLWLAGTDKVSVEVAAPISGVLSIVQEPGEEVPIGAVVALLKPHDVVRDPAQERRHQALVRAIATNPRDAGARQVYADFLLEQRQVFPWNAAWTRRRGELIARGGSDDASLAQLGHTSALQLFGTREGIGVKTRAGFVWSAAGSAEQLCQRHPQLRTRAALEELIVTGLDDDGVERLAALDWSSVQRLTLGGNLREVRRLSDAFAQVTWLELRSRAKDAPAPDILSCFPRLRELVLSGRWQPPLKCPSLASLQLRLPGPRGWLEAAELPQLQRLELRWRNPEAGALAAALRCFAQVKELNLHSVRVGFGPRAQDLAREVVAKLQGEGLLDGCRVLY